MHRDRQLAKRSQASCYAQLAARAFTDEHSLLLDRVVKVEVGPGAGPLDKHLPASATAGPFGQPMAGDLQSTGSGENRCKAGHMQRHWVKRAGLRQRLQGRGGTDHPRESVDATN